MGMRIPQSWAHEKLMIPEAEKDEPILGLVQAQPDASSGQPKDTQAAKLAALKAQEQQDVVDAYVDQLQGTANSASTEMINAIKQLVESAASLEEIREGLLTLNLPVDKLADAMNEAMAAASLAGRYELLQDAE